LEVGYDDVIDEICYEEKEYEKKKRNKRGN